MSARIHAEFRRDLIVAILLAGALTLGWSLAGWGAIARLRLPDTDDMMRLQQIRDWLGGQSFADVAQHRLGAPPGVEMHWSRLADLVPAAIVALLQPLAGWHAAEIVAVVAWPAGLFVAMMMLAASIARHLGAPGPVALVIAALSYPANAAFMPGSIDHHALQLVLLLLALRAAIVPGGLLPGAIGGVASAGALAIGLEHAPLHALVAAAIVARWICCEAGAQARLAGYATALFTTLALSALTLRSGGWDYPACDGFTLIVWRAAQVGAAAPLLLAAAGPRLHTVGARMAAAVATGVPVVAVALLRSPACLHPYGAVDPLLARLWLANVAEAQPLLAAPPSLAIGYAGFAVAGGAATLFQAARTRDARWVALAVIQLAALAMTVAQMRGAPAAAVLGIPGLARLVAAARARGVLFALPAWVAAAGLSYPLVGNALSPRDADGTTAGCPRDAILDRLAMLPHGRLLAPMDLGAYAVAATPHWIVAAPYHRNTQGNRALYQVFLGTPDDARAILRSWGVTYLADCPSSFAELGAPPRGSLLAALRGGTPPAWLTPLAGGDLYRVDADPIGRIDHDRLSRIPRSH